MARAAGTGGGRTHRGRTPWTYFSVIALVAILGVIGTVASRDRRLTAINNQGATAPTVGTIWNEGYAVYACGKFLAPITHAKNPYGITTGNGDGIIHIDPTVKSAAGKNATLGKFASAVGMKLNAAELQVPGGKLYLDGNSCSGKASHVYVMQFNFAGATTGTLATIDPRNILLVDQSLLTIAFVPAADKNSIPPPPATVQANLTKLAPAAKTTPSTTTPATPTTVTPTTVTPTTSTTVKKK